MNQQLYTRDDSPGKLWVLTGEGDADSATFTEVTSGPPDRHLWHFVDGTSQFYPRAEMVESHKSIDVTARTLEH